MKNIVCIIGGFRLPEGNASSVRAFGNAMLLKEIGYNPIIVGKFIDDNSSELWRSYRDIPCFNIQCGDDNYGTTTKFVEKLVSELGAENIYAFIVYNFPGVGLERIRRKASAYGIGMISDTTEWYAVEGKKLLPALIRKLQTELRMRIVNKRIKHIICSTYYIAEYYSNQHTIVIPMIDDTSFEKTEDRQPTVNQVRRYIYAGSPGYRFRKDMVNVIIKGFEKLREKGLRFQLDIYGISEKQYSEVFQQVNNNDSNSQIIFHGRVPRSEIDKALTISDFYILYRPNTQVCRVGFSTKAMEAISAGVPLVANDVNGDFSRYFTENQALLCGAEDEQGFFRTLEESICMPDENVIAMKRNCRIHNPFYYNRYTQQMEMFMKQVDKS